MCVRICTTVMVFLRNLCSSSLRSSIFSFSVWFSIFSCSKSITWRFSASSSFFRSISSSLARRFFKEMFAPRTSSTSASFSPSNFSISLMMRGGMPFPVLEYSAFWATCCLKSRKDSRHSIAFPRLSSSCPRSSSEIRAARTCCVRSFTRIWCTCERTLRYLCSVTRCVSISPAFWVPLLNATTRFCSAKLSWCRLSSLSW
mmetsp:Transcript_22453/g.56750  ORF Transcript_22453/g.56750 Transcript_22453/m.56750 type:complete len:201 (-) Transcript_22453:613-1215(-)